MMHEIQTSALWSQTSEMLENTESTSLVIVLVNVFCDCSWFILKYVNGLAYYGLSKVSKTNRESVRSYSVLDMSARPVSQVGVRWIDQLTETLRQRRVPTPLVRINFECFLQRRCVGYGVKFNYVVICEINKSVHRSEYEPNYESRQSILGEG